MDGFLCWMLLGWLKRRKFLWDCGNGIGAMGLMHSCILWFLVRLSKVIFILNFAAAISKAVKKNETAFVGVGDQEALYAAEIFFFGGIQNGGPRVGGPGGFLLLSNSAPVWAYLWI